ncbi:MAG: hypothetical protein GY839_19455 [candidate division Zixibacteria bacterium]|nr:hypothetical protein [candidate division Zixibacteria bacterium]
MAKECEYCGKRLSELKSYNFQGMDVCGKCLDVLDNQISLGLESKEHKIISDGLTVE